MSQIVLLSSSLDNLKPSQSEISQTAFDKIATLVEKEAMQPAKEMIEPIIAEGILDIRLIAYYCYAEFLEGGVVKFAHIFPFLTRLIKDFHEKLKPVNRKLKHVENSLNWICSQIIAKLKYNEKIQKEGKKPIIPAPSTRLQLEENLQALTEFQAFISNQWPKSPLHERILHLIQQVQDFEGWIPPELSPESKDINPPVQEPLPELQETPSVSQDLQTGSFSFESQEMRVLSKKLQLFSLLVEKKEYLKAALVSKDIEQIIQHFDPTIYFPSLFTPYFILLAKYSSFLAAQSQETETVQGHYLEKIYRLDMDAFIKW